MEVALPAKLDVLERERSVYLLLVYDSPADGGGVASIVRELVVALREDRTRCAR